MNPMMTSAFLGGTGGMGGGDSMDVSSSANSSASLGNGAMTQLGGNGGVLVAIAALTLFFILPALRKGKK